MNDDKTLENSIDQTIDETSAKTGLETEAGMSEAVDDVASSVLNIPQEELEPEPAQVATRPAPKSWSKEKHEIWSKLPKEAMDQIELREKQILDGLDQYKGEAGFGKQIRDITTPYKALLTSQGIDEAKAVQYFMNAHYKLSTLPPDQKAQYFLNLGKAFGIDPTSLQVEAPIVDPHMKALQDKVASLESNLTAREQQALTETRARVSKDVEAFASDPKHPYFDEVADDIVVMIKAGLTLEDAYEKAVWANPVTRAKELARVQTENETKLREQSRSDAQRARKASSPNVRGRDTNKAPTEPLGKMDDTLRETLREINNRTH